jgi:polysaccharide pyruvyl transferase CsaB
LPAAKRIFISGYYGFDNAGDEAILAVLLRQLREEFGPVRTTAVSGDPAATAALHDTAAIPWQDPAAMAEAVRAADLVIVGGGGLFHDYGGFLPSHLFTEGNFGLGFHSTAALMAALFGRPLMFYAVGVGPLFSEHGKRYTRAVCEAAGRISVRDSASRGILESIGVPPERVEVTADPVFALTPALEARAAAILETALPGAPRPLVVVSLRHWAFGVHPAFWQQEVAAGLDRFLEARGGSALFVPFQQIESTVAENDYAVAEAVRAQMRQRDHTAILRGRFRPEETAAVLGAADVVLSMRLHGSIFSAVAGSPCVALRYDPKVEEIARQIGGGLPLLDLGSITAQGVAGALEQALDAGPAPAAGIDRLRALAGRNVQLAREALETGPVRPLTPLVAELAAEGLEALLAAQRRMHSTDKQVRAVLESTEYRVRELEGQLESSKVDLVETRASLNQCERQLESLRTVELAAATDRATAGEGRAAVAEQRAEAAEQRAAAESERAAAAEARAATVEPLAGRLARVEPMWRAFASEYRRRLAIERGQRGWRLMLVARKAYSLLVREGWGGRLRLPFWALGLLVGRTGPLDRYELDLPDPPPDL